VQVTDKEFELIAEKVLQKCGFNCDINFQCQPLEAYDPDSCTTFNCPHYVYPDGPYNP
jgi:hypothetical protein